MVERRKVLSKSIVQKYQPKKESQHELIPSADNECNEPPNRKNRSRNCMAHLLEDSFDLESCNSDKLLEKIASCRENELFFASLGNTWLCKEGLKMRVGRRF